MGVAVSQRDSGIHVAVLNKLSFYQPKKKNPQIKLAGLDPKPRDRHKCVSCSYTCGISLYIITPTDCYILPTVQLMNWEFVNYRTIFKWWDGSSGDDDISPCCKHGSSSFHIPNGGIFVSYIRHVTNTRACAKIGAEQWRSVCRFLRKYLLL